MSDNSFEQAFGGTAFRRTFVDRLGRQEAPAEAAAEPRADMPGGQEYRAYGFLPSGNIGETCDVQRWMDGTDTAEGIEFQYRFLMQVGYVADKEIKLYLPDCVILIEGRNLHEVRKKLARRQVTFVQQFSCRVWRERPESHSSLVESIKIVRPDGTEG